jgi:hypothetical protein
MIVNRMIIYKFGDIKHLNIHLDTFIYIHVGIAKKYIIVPNTKYLTI